MTALQEWIKDQQKKSEGVATQGDIDVVANLSPPSPAGYMEADPLLRHLISGFTGGYSEKFHEWRGQPPLESSVLGTGLEVGGGLLGVGKGLNVARNLISRIPTVARGLKASPRLSNLALSTGESAAGGALEAGGHDEDIATGALWGGGFGAGLSGLAQGGGALLDRIWRRGVPGTAFSGLEPKEYVVPDDPFDPPPFIENEGLNQGLVDWVTARGIEVLPEAVRAQDPTVKFMLTKTSQMSAALPYLQAQGKRVVKQFDDGMKNISSMLPANMASVSNLKMGEHVSVTFRNSIDDLRQAAVQGYDELFKMGDLGSQPINARALADELRLFLKAEGFDDIPVAGGVAKVKNLISFLSSKAGTEPKIGGFGYPDVPVAKSPATYNDAWRQMQKWWPSSKVWDASDAVGVRAMRVVKNHLREAADKSSPLAGVKLAEADLNWSKMHKELDSDFGKLMSSSDAEELPELLTKNIAIIRETRDKLGDDMVTKLAQRKIDRILFRAADPETKIITAKSYSRELKAAGGEDGTIGGEYWDELLRDFPEVRQELDDYRRALSIYSEPLSKYHGSFEGMGGGTERLALTTIAQSPSTIFKLLAHFALGKRLGENIASGKGTNYLLGPGISSPGRIAAVAEGVRHAEAATGGIQKAKRRDDNQNRSIPLY